MSTRGRQFRGPVAFWALAGIALLVSHDAIFFVQYGPGEALTRSSTRRMGPASSSWSS
jgi:hypothetical protein